MWHFLLPLSSFANVISIFFIRMCVHFLFLALFYLCTVFFLFRLHFVTSNELMFAFNQPHTFVIYLIAQITHYELQCSFCSVPLQNFSFDFCLMLINCVNVSHIVRSLQLCIHTICSQQIKMFLYSRWSNLIEQQNEFQHIWFVLYRARGKQHPMRHAMDTSIKIKR